MTQNWTVCCIFCKGNQEYGFSKIKDTLSQRVWEKFEFLRIFWRRQYTCAFVGLFFSPIPNVLWSCHYYFWRFNTAISFKCLTVTIFATSKWEKCSFYTDHRLWGERSTGTLVVVCLTEAPLLILLHCIWVSGSPTRCLPCHFLICSRACQYGVFVYL